MESMRRAVTLLLLAVLAISVGGADAARHGATCFGRTATIVQGPGNDDISGTNGVDVIVAGDGDDVVAGKEGDDFICGGDGDDELHGGDDTDKTDGGSGDDFLDGRRGVDDTLLGGGGEDLLLGGGVLEGGAGPDILRSYSYESEIAVDVLRGGDGRDELEADGEDGFGERLFGGPGRDFLWGKSGEDRLEGGSGNDDLDGGGKRDRLDGGPQEDRCVRTNEDAPPRNCEEVV